MHYAQIRQYDVANGPGIRTTIFVTGCTIGCKNCFNAEYQDFNYGSEWTDRQTEEVIGYLKDDNIEGLTVLGGEPFDNAEDLIDILREIKSRIDKNIWIFSGHLYEDLLKGEKTKSLLKLCDVLVDGPFIEEKKDLMLRFRGSSNQRIIDIPKSLESGKVILEIS